MQVTALLVQPAEVAPTDADLVQVDPADPGTVVPGPLTELLVTEDLRMVAGEDPSLPVNVMATKLYECATYEHPSAAPVTFTGPALLIHVDAAGNGISVASANDEVFLGVLTTLLTPMLDGLMDTVFSGAPALMLDGLMDAVFSGAAALIKVAPTGCTCEWSMPVSDPTAAQLVATDPDCVIHGAARN